MKKPKPAADTTATEAAASPTRELDDLGTLGDLLGEVDRLQHRQGVLRALLDYLYDNFIGAEGEAPKARITREDGSQVPPREDVVTAITEELSRAGAATRVRLAAILGAHVEGRLPGSVPCVSYEGAEERGHAAQDAAGDVPRRAAAPRARGSKMRGSSKSKRSGARAPTA